jgi:hypothetical protein
MDLMALMALMEILKQKYGEDIQLTRGCEYSVEMTLEEVISILGEPPDTSAVYGVNLKKTDDGDYEVITERHPIN